MFRRVNVGVAATFQGRETFDNDVPFKIRQRRYVDSYDGGRGFIPKKGKNGRTFLIVSIRKKSLAEGL